MRKKIIASILSFTMVSALMAGCAGAGSAGNTAAPAAETAEASETALTEEEAAATGETPETEDGYEGPEDFLQDQSGKLEFKDFDEVISCLKDGQGYAYIKVYGYDGDVLAVAEQVFLADHSAPEASLYAMKDGKPHCMGLVTGNGSAYPLRLADGIIYGGDNHNYQTYFLSESAGFPGIMQKDLVYDGIDSDGKFGGFMRDDNVFDKDKDFTGGQEEFDALIAERESKPIIEFTIIGGEESGPQEESSINPPYLRALEMYKDKLEEAPKEMYYAFADMDEDSDALLLTEKEDDVFTDNEGNHYAVGAAVYAPDKDGNIISYGRVESGGTAIPLSIKDRKIYHGNHSELFTSTLNKDNGKIDTTSSTSFDDLDDNVMEIVFSPVSELDEESGSASALPAYKYPGTEEMYAEIADYLIKTCGSHFEKAGVCIPYFEKVAVDDSNKDDIIFYGSFWVENYDQKGDTLECVSGGNFPGAIHLKKLDKGYDVSKMDAVEDGSNFDTSAKKIYGKYYDDFMKIYSNDEGSKKVRKQFISDYVKANNLDIKAYKDYGWDPVSLD